MVTLNAKIKERFVKGIKKYQPILRKAQAADINESDTVTIITDMLCDVFGYDKYDNITSEYAIKKTYCDLAIKVNDTIPYLIECKSAGLELKDDHIRQATNYSADSGIDWVVLTNGVSWKIYKILFQKPVEKQLIYEFNFCELSGKKLSDLELLYYLSIESFSKSSKATLEDLRAQKQILNKHIIGQVLLTEPVIDAVRKHMKKLYPDIRVDNDQLSAIIFNEVIKREIVDGDSATEAQKTIQKAERKAANQKQRKAQSNPAE